jgi:hypothetical protein
VQIQTAINLALGLALLGLLLLWRLTAAERDVAVSTLDSVRVQRDAQQAERQAAMQSAQAWQQEAEQAWERLRGERAQLATVAAEHAAAAAAARAAEQDASRTLAAWTARYAAALREPGCAAILAAPVGAACPELAR